MENVFVHPRYLLFWNIKFDVAMSLIWSKGLLSSVSRWLSSQFGRRRSRMSRTWFTSAERLRSCHPSATHTSFLYMKVKVCCMSGNTHTHTRMANHTPPPFIWTHINKNTSVQNSPLPQLIQHLWPSSRIVMSWHADVIIRPGLQLWDVIHLLCSVWLPGPVKVWMALTVCIWISQKMCVCTCVLKVSVCKRGGILRDCLSHIWEVSSLAFSRLDLRARHLLILRDNCSWEPEWSVLVCVCLHICVSAWSLCLCMSLCACVCG